MRDLKGRIFGRLTVLGFSHYSEDGKIRYWNCKCECGNCKAVPEITLLNGSAQSCGCLRKEVAKELMTTHGDSKSAFYRTWGRLKSICYNEKNKEYPYYGAKGITVCKEWMEYDGFRDWAYKNGYEPNKKLRLVRLDNTKGFSPENCEWRGRKQGIEKETRAKRKSAVAAHKQAKIAPKRARHPEARISRGRQREDLTGRVFGKLTVLGFSHKKGTANYWLCRCECGNEKPIARSSLTSGASRSCGCSMGKRREDLTGRVFGKLTVVEYAGTNGFVSYWRCKCECGNETVVQRGSLIRGATRSCGCLAHGRQAKGTAKMDIIGKRFGRLTVIAFDGIRGRRISYWRCRCDCGNEIILPRSNLLSGSTKSCGCLQKERREKPITKHGASKTKLYRKWCNLKSQYKSNLCAEWMDFIAFKDWALSNGYSENERLYLHRKDPDREFSPSNCEWITRVKAEKKRRGV